jgi:hypothetical protein
MKLNFILKYQPSGVLMPPTEHKGDDLVDWNLLALAFRMLLVYATSLAKI